MGRRHTKKKRPPFAIPKEIVLLRTPDGWRHSILTAEGGTACGQLSQVPAAAGAETAQTAATAMLRELALELHGVSIEVSWDTPRTGDSSATGIHTTGVITECKR